MRHRNEHLHGGATHSHVDSNTATVWSKRSSQLFGNRHVQHSRQKSSPHSLLKGRFFDSGFEKRLSSLLPKAPIRRDLVGVCIASTMFWAFFASLWLAYLLFWAQSTTTSSIPFSNEPFLGVKFKNKAQTIGSDTLLENEWLSLSKHKVHTENGQTIDDWLWVDIKDQINVLVSVRVPVSALSANKVRSAKRKPRHLLSSVSESDSSNSDAIDGHNEESKSLGRKLLQAKSQMKMNVLSQKDSKSVITEETMKRLRKKLESVGNGGSDTNLKGAIANERRDEPRVGRQLTEEVFLVFNQTKYGLDGYSLAVVGGHIEDGELPQTAAKRELSEELRRATARHSDWTYFGAFRTDVNRGLGYCHTFLARNTVRIDAAIALDALQLENEEFSDETETLHLVTLTLEQLSEEFQKGAFKEAKWSNTVGMALMHLLK